MAAPPALVRAAAVLAAVLGACSTGGSAQVATPTVPPTAPTTVAAVPPPTQPPPTRPQITKIEDCSPIPQAVGPPEAGVMEAVGAVALFFEEGVPASARAQVMDGISAAQRYLTEQVGGFRFDEPACFDVRAASSRSTTVGVVYGANHVILYTGARALIGAPGWLLSHVAAHEYIHFWQKDIGSPRDGAGPVWLLEGAAELLGYQALVHSGVVGYEEARLYSLRRLPPSTITLPSMERRSSDPEEFSYPLAFFAAEMLAAEGPSTIRTYWRALSRGTPWEVAFNDAFAVPPADFYGRFEEQRRRNFAR